MLSKKLLASNFWKNFFSRVIQQKHQIKLMITNNHKFSSIQAWIGKEASLLDQWTGRNDVPLTFEKEFTKFKHKSSEFKCSKQYYFTLFQLELWQKFSNFQNSIKLLLLLYKNLIKILFHYSTGKIYSMRIHIGKKKYIYVSRDYKIHI